MRENQKKKTRISDKNLKVEYASIKYHLLMEEYVYEKWEIVPKFFFKLFQTCIKASLLYIPPSKVILNSVEPVPQATLEKLQTGRKCSN